MAVMTTGFDASTFRALLDEQVASGDVDFDRVMSQSLRNEEAAKMALAWLGSRREPPAIEVVSAALAGAWVGGGLIEEMLPRTFLRALDDAARNPVAAWAAAQAVARLLVASVAPGLRKDADERFSTLIAALDATPYANAARELEAAVASKRASTEAPDRELASLRELVDDHLGRGKPSDASYHAMSAGLAAVGDALTMIRTQATLGGAVVAKLREGIATLRATQQVNGAHDPELKALVTRQLALAELVESEVVRIQAGESTLV